MPRAKKSAGPSLVEVTVGAALSVLLGSVLAAAYLIVQPVETVRTLPAEPDPAKTYYVTGSARSALGGQWLRKRQMVVEGGTFEIRFNEDELNTWMTSSIANPDDRETGGVLTATGVNFRVRDGVMQIGMPCTLSLLGLQRDVIVQAKGGFERGAEQFVFAPDSVLIGQLAVDRIPLVGGLIVDRLLSVDEVPGDLATAWRSLTEVKVDDNVLVLARR